MHQEFKRVVKTYNKLAMALVQYEASWHQGWLETCTLAKVRSPPSFCKSLWIMAHLYD